MTSFKHDDSSSSAQKVTQQSIKLPHTFIALCHIGPFRESISMNCEAEVLSESSSEKISVYLNLIISLTIHLSN